MRNMRLYMKLFVSGVAGAILTLLGLYKGVEMDAFGIGFTIGIVSAVFVAFIVLATNDRRIPHLIGYFLTSYTTGFVISEYFVKMNHMMEISELYSVFLVLVLSLGLVLMILSVVRSRGLKITLLVGTIVIGYIVTITNWGSNTDLFGTLFFLLHIVYALGGIVIAMEGDEGDVDLALFIAGFVYFFVVGVIVLIIISEGEAIEGLGYGFDGGIGSKKPKDPSQGML